VPTSPATRQVAAFHQLAGLTEEGIAAAADAPVLGTRQPVSHGLPTIAAAALHAVAL
jgi:hypothetical protein